MRTAKGMKASSRTKREMAKALNTMQTEVRRKGFGKAAFMLAQTCSDDFDGKKSKREVTK